MVTSGSFHRKGPIAAKAAGVKGTPAFAAGRFATLDAGRLTSIGRGMNDPEVTMPEAIDNTDLVALDKALEAASSAISLVMRVPAPLKSIADQVIRSASSVPANLAEGQGRSGRDRTYLWRIAYASAKEVDCHLKLLAHAGVINGVEAQKAIETFDEVRAMTWRLLDR
jgi:four helix bundle protein